MICAACQGTYTKPFTSAPKPVKKKVSVAQCSTKVGDHVYTVQSLHWSLTRAKNCWKNYHSNRII
eukprot:3560670-Amphidinium_carterae.1